MIELENILIKEHDGELVYLPSMPNSATEGDVVFCVLPFFAEYIKFEKQLAQAKDLGCKVIIYVFDSWDTYEILYSKRRSVRDVVLPRFAITHVVDRICLPFQIVADQLKPHHRKLVKHVPLAVDTKLANGYNPVRPITVLAYGAQRGDLTNLLAEELNNPAASAIFHHTNHVSIVEVNDPHLHRLHFWKLAQSSLISLTFDPSITSSHRAPISIVSQRYYESLAAGCVLAGRLPTSPETDELLNWKDAVIELPDHPLEALEVLKEIWGNGKRIAEMRERNVSQVRARHDWRHRIPSILDI